MNTHPVLIDLKPFATLVLSPTVENDGMVLATAPGSGTGFAVLSRHEVQAAADSFAKAAAMLKES